MMTGTRGPQTAARVHSNRTQARAHVMSISSQLVAVPGAGRLRNGIVTAERAISVCMCTFVFVAQRLFAARCGCAEPRASDATP